MFNYAITKFNEDVIEEPLGINPIQFWESIKNNENIYTSMIALRFEYFMSNSFLWENQNWNIIDN